MAKRDKSTENIQRLLEERRKVEQWLERLAMAADKTSDDVRTKVRGDYQARLDKVNKELQGYVDDIESALERHRGTFRGLKEQEEAKSKQLAEAELRHAVGEFDEDVWRRKKGEILEELVGIREGLAEAEEEIQELESVLASLEGRAAEEEEADIAPLDEEDDDEEVPAVAVSDGGGQGGKRGKRTSGQTEAFGDELEFLKSVTAGKEKGGARGKEKPAAAKAGAGGSGERTLKCNECGAMNLPTEWYCERCGAELAAL